MLSEEIQFVNQITDLYNQILKLKSLRPSNECDTLFEKLETLCMTADTNIDVQKMSHEVQGMRSHLIKLHGEATGYLEKHFSEILGSLEDNPVDHVDLYPSYLLTVNMIKLELDLIRKHTLRLPTKIAFVGSGSIPMSSIVLAKFHLPNTTFHNFDIDHQANALATHLVSRDPDLSQRLFFYTTDILNMTAVILREYDVIFLASMVGLTKEAKVKAIEHLEKHMAPGALLMLRSSHGLRSFIYQSVDSCDLKGFNVLTIHHPMSNKVPTSVVIARKLGRKSTYEENNGVRSGKI